MLVGTVMSRKPVTVERDHTVLHVARVLKEEDVGAVVVVDGKGRPIGICTDRDLAVRAFLAEGAGVGEQPVDRIMTRPVVTVDEDTLMFDLLRLMARKRIRRVPVVDGRTQSLRGIVSMDDIILLLTTELANVAEVLGHSSRVLGDRASEEE
jgi:CBS domain-containing protein